jgi:hypothetical protein
MDDFPRPNNCRGHIDIQSWMYFFTKFMSSMAILYGEENQVFIKI